MALFEIDPIIRRLDDDRIRALNAGSITEADLMRLVRQDDPFAFVNGVLHYISPEEEKQQREGFVKSRIVQIKQTGDIDANYLYEHQDEFLSAYPEASGVYEEIRAIIEKDSCTGCAMRAHSRRMLDAVLALDPSGRDLSAITADVVFNQRFPHGLARLRRETITVDESKIQIPPFFARKRVPILPEGSENKTPLPPPAVEAPTEPRKHTDRKDVVELLLAIANAAHAEYHLVESMSYNQEKNLAPLTAALGDARRLRVDLMQKLADSNPNARSLWCTLKHLLLLQFHLMELHERAFDGKYLELSRRVSLLVDDLLSADLGGDFRDCPRCEDDRAQ